MPHDPRTPEEIFGAAIEIASPQERADFLKAACGVDTELLRSVEKLANDHFRAGSFLDVPADRGDVTQLRPLVEVSEKPGDTIGPYKLLEQIGEGGFGVVFMAEQTAPVKRKVALKVIKPGMDTREVIARFEAEQQALALMDHPNIAKVLDAGATDTGRPFFVMELVRGAPITEYCDQHHLSPNERLELFVTVCHAVQHAHQKGIIHRDIKPTNVLVTLHDDRPVVKVIDFGVAKAISGQLTDKTLFTGFAQVIGTPLYMSPEQAALSAIDIDTRSDIYSLGVLLYELLTGTTPFDKTRLQQAAFEEIRRIIREEEPQKPSTRLNSLGDTLPSVSAVRRMEPRKLSQFLRGDLDWIVMKALEKDRVRRYQTSNGFAADVLRYLADEPVEACPPSAAYRAKKFVRRNKAGLTITLVVALAILLVVGSLGWMVRDRAARDALIARERTARQENLVQEVVAALAEAEDWHQRENWPEAMAAVRRAEALMASADAPSALNTGVRQWRTNLETVARLEEISLSRDGEQWDFSRAADAEFEREFRALGIEIDERAPKDAAELVRKSPIRDSLTYALETWAGMRRNIMAEAVARGWSKPADWWRRPLAAARMADPDEYRTRVRLAIEREDAPALAELAASPEMTSLPASTLGWVARVLHWHDGGRHRQLALELLTAAQARQPNSVLINGQLSNYLLQADPPDVVRAIPYDMAAIALRPQSTVLRLRLASSLRRSGRPDEALSMCRQAIEISPASAMAHCALGDALQARGHLDEAIAAYRVAIRLKPDAAAFHNNLGAALKEQGRLDEAVVCYRRAIELDPELAAAHNNLGVALMDQGQLDEAVASLRKAIELDPSRASRHDNLGLALQKRGELDQAVACYRRAIELDPEFAMAHNNLGVALERQGKPDEAVACYHRAIDLDPKFALAHNNLGNQLRAQGDLDASIVALRTALAIDPEFALVHFNLGTVLHAQQRLDEAVAEYREAIRLQPDDVAAHFSLARICFAQNRIPEAIVEYEATIKLRPDAPVPHNELAWLLATCQEPSHRDAARAVQLACGAVELAPETADFWNTLGVAQYRAGDWNAALDALNKSIELREGGDANDWYFQAMAHWRLDHKDEARQWYDKAAQWMNAHAEDNAELLRFRSEAAQLIGLTVPTPPEAPTDTKDPTSQTTTDN